MRQKNLGPGGINHGGYDFGRGEEAMEGRVVRVCFERFQGRRFIIKGGAKGMTQSYIKLEEVDGDQILYVRLEEIELVMEDQ